MPDTTAPQLATETVSDKRLESLAARLAMPVLLALVSVLGGAMLQDIRGQLREQGDGQRAQGLEIKDVSASVQLLNAKVDNGLVWRMGELERRVQVLEGSTAPAATGSVHR
jgi:hypothetical protein